MIDDLNFQRGKVIVFDGINVSGKTTQIKNLIDFLTRKRIPVFALSEQNVDVSKVYLSACSPLIQKEVAKNEGYRKYLDLTPKIGQVIINEFEITPPLTSALLFYTIRTYTTPFFNELLDKGIWIILDKYIYSTYVYQCNPLQDKPIIFEQLDSAFTLANNIDLTIILTVSKDTYVHRLTHTKRNVSFGSVTDTFDTFSNRFLDLKTVFPAHNIHNIDSNKVAEEVFEDIVNLVKKEFKVS